MDDGKNMEKEKMICTFCKDNVHRLCMKKHGLGERCDCVKCREEFLLTLRITEVAVKNGGRCLMVKIGNNTTFIDVRDLCSSPSWLDRDDNREEALGKLRNDKDD